MKEHKSKVKNVWKTVSVVFIVLFFLILIVGIMRAYHFKSSFITATEDQVNSARTIVSQELQNKGEEIDDYEIYVGNKIRKHGRNAKSIIQVSLLKDSTRHLYLIDIDSHEIVLHSETEFYSWMNNSNENFKAYRRKNRWFHNRFQKD